MRRYPGAAGRRDGPVRCRRSQGAGPSRGEIQVVVREGGIEPPWAEARRILSPERLPVPPLPRDACRENTYHSPRVVVHRRLRATGVRQAAMDPSISHAEAQSALGDVQMNRRQEAEAAPRPENRNRWSELIPDHRPLTSDPVEARGGFEPPSKGFADLPLNHLGTAPCGQDNKPSEADGQSQLAAHSGKTSPPGPAKGWEAMQRCQSPPKLTAG
jgi:hypothetical protein